MDRAKFSNEIARFHIALANAAPIADRARKTAMLLLDRAKASSTPRNTPEWKEMEDAFSKLYHSEEIKIALEQALFSAVYSFIQKEPLSQVELRIKKYANYFHSLLEILPHFSELLKSL